MYIFHKDEKNLKRNLKKTNVHFSPVWSGGSTGVGAGFFLLSFRRKMVKRSSPEEYFGQANPFPLSPKKIARYLVLSAQKRQKIGGLT